MSRGRYLACFDKCQKLAGGRMANAFALMMRSGPNDDEPTAKRSSKRRRVESPKNGDIFLYFKRLGASDERERDEAKSSSKRKGRSSKRIKQPRKHVEEPQKCVEEPRKRVDEPMTRLRRRIKSEPEPIEIIDVDEPNKTSKKKISPLLTKRGSKIPTNDNSASAVARRQFLYSETPRIVKKSTEIASQALIRAPFPIVSHVQQISNESDFDVWNLPNVQLELNEQIILKHTNGLVYFQHEPSAEPSSFIEQSARATQSSERLSRREALRNLKVTSPKFPVYKFYKRSKQKLQDQVSDTIEQLDNGSVHRTWVETYKPSCSEDIIGNYKSVESLKNWLTIWKESTRAATLKRFERNDADSDSSDEFLSDSNSCDAYTSNNVKLIVGPCGSGKTSSIYAIANELDINVLEVNASSRRTGKKVLSELGEATQSHKVTVDGKSHFRTVKPEKKNKSKSSVSKNCSNKFSSQLSNKKNKSSKRLTESTIETNKKMSLILIEDADIVFDDDDGFVGAISQIIQTSKRPIIIVSSDANCNHLKKFICNDNVIKFRRLSGGVVGAWLDILILLENQLCIPGFSRYLVDFNKGDVRKTMLQLYFWVSREKSICKEKNNTKLEICADDNSPVDCNGESVIVLDDDTNDSELFVKKSFSTDQQDNIEIFLLDNVCFTRMNYVWWDIYKMHIQRLVSENKQNKISNEVVLTNSKQCTSDTINSISAALDSISVFDVVQSYKNCNNMDQSYTPWRLQLTNSLSESETMEEYNNYEPFSNAWCQYLINNDRDINCYASHKEIFDDFSFQAKERVWIDKHHRIHSELSKAVPPVARLDRSSFTLDYISSLRQMCRLEENRCNTNMKRNNRFYHYLRSFGVEMKDHILNDACKIFKL